RRRVPRPIGTSREEPCGRTADRQRLRLHPQRQAAAQHSHPPRRRRDRRGPMTIAATDEGPLGIICGGGTIPLAVAAAAQRRGRRVLLFPLRGFVDAKSVAGYRHYWVAIGQF